MVVGLALMLPATTVGASPGKITFEGYCSGQNTVNGTFTVTKFSGFHGTKLTLTVKGQGYHDGAWRTEVTLGSWSKTFNTSARVSLAKFVSYNPGHGGLHRLLGIGKVWDGAYVLGGTKLKTGTCG
jgi:hypothetical protein